MSLRTWMCRHGRHLWSKPRITQYATHRVVVRECWFCPETRTIAQDVWSEPTREFTTTWADHVRAHARDHGGAA